MARRTVFPGVEPASIDFQAVRDGRRARPLYVQLALDVARSLANGTTEDPTDTSGKALVIRTPANSVFSDPLYDAAGNYIAGIVVAHFNDSALGTGISTPITLLPNSAESIPYTQLFIENFAQAGKVARLVLGVDIDFVPGFNSQTTIAGTIAAVEQGFTYGASFSSAALLGANVSQQVFAPAANVNGAVVWMAEGFSGNATGIPEIVLQAAAAAPNSVTAGDVLAGPLFVVQGGAAAVNAANVRLNRAVRIAAGKGLWFTVQIAETLGYRAVAYTLL